MVVSSFFGGSFLPFPTTHAGSAPQKGKKLDGYFYLPPAANSPRAAGDREVHANQPSPANTSIRYRMRRAKASARPEAEGNPNIRNAAAMPVSSAPMRAGSHPPMVLTT